MSKGRKISREGAIRNLQRMFKDATTDYVSVNDIFANAERTGIPLEKNKNWLYNVLSATRSYGFFEKVEGVENGARVTKGIRLTSEGRRALQITPVALPIPATPDNREVTFASVRADVRKLREKYPDFNITFDARLKEDEDES